MKFVNRLRLLLFIGCVCLCSLVFSYMCSTFKACHTSVLYTGSNTKQRGKRQIAVFTYFTEQFIHRSLHTVGHKNKHYTLQKHCSK